MSWFSISTALNILVIFVLLVDIVYRVKYRRSLTSTSAEAKNSSMREIFSDFKNQLSFTRVSLAAIICLAFLMVGVGWYWPSLQAYCSNAFDKFLDFGKVIFGLGKSPETFQQLGGIIKGTVDKAKSGDIPEEG